MTRKDARIGGLCLAGALLAAPVPAVAGNGATFFLSPDEFSLALQEAGKVSKTAWNFKPTNLPPGNIIHIENPLDINTHPVVAPGIWNNPDGSTFWPPDFDNVQFIGTKFGLYFDTGLFAQDNNILGTDDFGGVFTILSGPPAGDNHTAMALEISDPFSLTGVTIVEVFNKEGLPLGTFLVQAPPGAKSFLGILVPQGETIGRVDIRDETPEGGAPGISFIELYLKLGQEPVCPYDCALDAAGIPTYDKVVGILDFLTLLAQWGAIGTSCDPDNDGVGIIDFLGLLAAWGPCPAPPNDECEDKIIIDRLDPAGQIVEHFDMYGATPSPEASQCQFNPNTLKDIWYCLRNNTNEFKLVTVTGTVNGLVEVTAGCVCPPPPGSLIGCGLLVLGGVSFPMAPGDEVCLRVIDDLGLPNDQLKGDLIITNEPIQPPDDVNLFLDPGLFFQTVAAAGKEEKLFWDFKPHSLPPGGVAQTAVPLDINTHGTVQGDPWTAPDGTNLWPPFVDNLQFLANLTPQGPLTPGGDGTLVFATAGFLPDINNNFLAENVGDEGAFDILSGPPAGDNHTAIAVELAASAAGIGFPPGTPVTYHVSVYDKQDLEIGKFLIPGVTGEKIFAGFLTKDPAITIGRIDIFSAEGFFDGISAIWAFQQFQPVCDDCVDGMVNACNADPNCHDCVLPDGSCICVQAGFCDPAQQCDANGNCPPGFFCCVNTCCSFPICLPLCSSPIAGDLPEVSQPGQTWSDGVK